MTAERFLSEQTKKELGDFLTLYMQGEPPALILPRDNVAEDFRERIESENVRQKRQYYNDLYRAAKRFIFSYEVTFMEKISTDILDSFEIEKFQTKKCSRY